MAKIISVCCILFLFFIFSLGILAEGDDLPSLPPLEVGSIEELEAHAGEAPRVDDLAIYLSGQFLTNPELLRVAQALPSYRNLMRLNLDLQGNDMSVIRVVEQFMGNLGRLTALTDIHLNLSNCTMGESGYLLLGSLLMYLKNLTRLTLIVRNNSPEATHMFFLSALSAQKHLTHLTLDLRDNSLRAIDIGHLASALEGLAETLTELSLSFSADLSQSLGGTTIAVYFTNSLGRLINLRRLTLDLRSSHIGGIEAIRAALRDLPNLAWLRLNYNGTPITLHTRAEVMAYLGVADDGGEGGGTGGAGGPPGEADVPAARVSAAAAAWAMLITILGPRPWDKRL